MGRSSDSDDQDRYPPGFAEALGRTIKVLRTDLGMERRELADAAGISYSYLTEIENGNKPPSSSRLAPIARALGLRMYQLLEAAEVRMEDQARESPSPSESRLLAGGPLELGLMDESRLPSDEAARALSPRLERMGTARQPSHGRRVAFNLPRDAEPELAMQPSLRGPNRDLRAAVIEIERLLRGMAPEDIERLLDFARRLSR